MQIHLCLGLEMRHEGYNGKETLVVAMSIFPRLRSFFVGCCDFSVLMFFQTKDCVDSKDGVETGPSVTFCGSFGDLEGGIWDRDGIRDVT